MTTQEAMAHALAQPAVKADYNASTCQSLCRRLSRGELTLDYMVGFLVKHGYAVEQEYSWREENLNN